MTLDAIDRIRAFNRSYTARMGLLERDYLSSDMTVTQVRVLYELCEDGPASLRDLATRLDLDEGYLSRLVDRFVRRGWVRKETPPDDARRRVIVPLDAGRAAFEPLKERSRLEVARRLGGAEAEAVASAIAAVDRSLASVDPAEVTLRDLAIGDAGWLVQRHGELYARDEGFDATFEALVAEILAAYIRTRDSTERAWIAEHQGTRLGSIFCVRSGESGVAKLRLFLLEPRARGLGLGQRLLDECMAFARNKGNRTLRLWTHESHRAACALYARNGFELVRSEPKTSFGVPVVEQEWELGLS
jgi:DNA-binding MarR family transcriptional regulator/ribosomal protein S18 acetylase RimI-like enzyme